MKPILLSNRSKTALVSVAGAGLLALLSSAPQTGAPLQAAPNLNANPVQDATLPAPSAAAIAALEPSKLSRGQLSDAAYAFKKEVYRLHVARGLKSGRTRIYDLPPEWLAPIPGTDISMRRDAAAHLGELLAAANLDLKRDLAMNPTNAAETLRQNRARRVRELGVGNAYRSASRQFGLWNRYFGGYYEATRAKRAALPGGEHGAAAAEFLREYTGIRVAAPGFSNHQGGIAVDLALRLLPENGKPVKDLGASTAQADPWKSSWFWNWLKSRAGEFGFVEYEAEAWHWEYKPDQAAKMPAPIQPPPGPSQTPASIQPPPGPRPLLVSGNKGEWVKYLQKLLNAAGANPALNADGDFGPGTKVAVSKFQKSRGLTADGDVGPKTWAALIPAAP